MANEPKPNIEEMLRTCAQRQRDLAGEPLELDSAARARLLDEVARAYPPTAPVAASRWDWLVFWPRLAWTVGVVAIFAVVSIVCWPILRSDRADFQIAKSTELGRSIEIPALPPAPASARGISFLTNVPSIQSGGAKMKVADAKTTHFDAKSESKPVSGNGRVSYHAPAAPSWPAPTAQNPRPTALVDASAALQEKGSPQAAAPEPSAQRFGLASAPPAVRDQAAQPTAPRPALERSRPDISISQETAPQGQTERNLFSQQYRQDGARSMYRRNFNSPPLPKVLDSFRVEQNAESIVIIDQDGSIYSGSIRAKSIPHAFAHSVTQAREPAHFASNVASQPGLPDHNAQIGQDYEFTVQGTNRTLQQKVVFQGQYSQAPATDVARQQQRASSRSAQAGIHQQNLMNVQAPRINGTVVIGHTNQLTVDAFLEEPPPNR